MNNWTVRTLIISAFSAIILVMAALGVVTFLRLQEIQGQATLVEADVLPGVLVSGQANSLAKDLLPAVMTRATAADAAAKQRAADGIERALVEGVRLDGVYGKAITTEEDRRLFELARTTRQRSALPSSTTTVSPSGPGSATRVRWTPSRSTSMRVNAGNVSSSVGSTEASSRTARSCAAASRNGRLTALS